MSLRDTLTKIYPLIKKDEPFFIFFLIGSYPQRKESNHEFPNILNSMKKFGRNIVLFIYVSF